MSIRRCFERDSHRAKEYVNRIRPREFEPRRPLHLHCDTFSHQLILLRPVEPGSPAFRSFTPNLKKYLVQVLIHLLATNPLDIQEPKRGFNSGHRSALDTQERQSNSACLVCVCMCLLRGERFSWETRRMSCYIGRSILRSSDGRPLSKSSFPIRAYWLQGYYSQDHPGSLTAAQSSVRNIGDGEPAVFVTTTAQMASLRVIEQLNLYVKCCIIETVH